MKRTMMSVATALALAGLAVAASMPAPAETDTYFGFQTGVGNAPLPPRVVFREAPRMRTDPRSGVRFLADDPGYDMFRYSSWYYISSNGYWYRSPGYRGPFRALDATRVPREVLDVPAEYWHHRPQASLPTQGKPAQEHGPLHGETRSSGQGRRTP